MARWWRPKIGPWSHDSGSFGYGRKFQTSDHDAPSDKAPYTPRDLFSACTLRGDPGRTATWQPDAWVGELQASEGFLLKYLARDPGYRHREHMNVHQGLFSVSRTRPSEIATMLGLDITTYNSLVIALGGYVYHHP